MTLETLLFAALPGGLIVAGLLAVPFRIGAVPASSRRPPGTPRHAWAQVALAGGLGLYLTGIAVAVLAPGWVAGWGSSLPRRILAEGAVVATGVWWLMGLLSHLYDFGVDPGRSRVSVADAVVVAGGFMLAVSGVLITLTYRWSSLWGSHAAAGWVRGMLTGSARPELIGDLPMLVRIHALTFAATFAVFPYSRWVGWLRHPVGAARGFWSELRRPPENRPAGAWVGWGAAFARAALIVAYFVLATVLLPSVVVDRLGGGVPSAVRDLIVVSVWGVFLVGGVAALRVLQRKARL